MDSGCWGRGTSHALAIKTNFAWCRPQVETKGAGVGLRPSRFWRRPAASLGSVSLGLRVPLV